MHLEQVRPAQVDVVWRSVEPTLASVCERHPDCHSLEALYTRFNNSAYQLWLVIDMNEADPVRAVFCTEVYRTDVGAKTCAIVICAAANGSSARDWVHLIADVEAWASREGCTRFRLEARRGWVRWLRPKGYQPGHMILEKGLP